LFEAAAKDEKAEIEAPAEPIDLMYVKDVARAFLHLTNHTGPLDLIYNLTAYSATADSLANVVQEIRPASEVRVKPIRSAYHYPTVNGEKLGRKTGFSHKFDLRAACEDYINELAKA
jgi:nucleoside-diphosphate-sugar epimerase